MNRITPVLRMFDYNKAQEFYVDWLEFKIDWEHRFADNFPLYLQLSKEEIKLHLTEHHGDCSPGAKLFINYNNLHEFQQRLCSKDYKYYKPSVEEAPWGSLCMEVTDPFGNKLVFTHPK